MGWREMILVRPTGPGGVSDFFFNGPGPGGFVFQWFAQRVCGVGVGFGFNGPARGGFCFFFQWSAQRARGDSFFNGSPNGSAG